MKWKVFQCPKRLEAYRISTITITIRRNINNEVRPLYFHSLKRLRRNVKRRRTYKIPTQNVTTENRRLSKRNAQANNIVYVRHDNSTNFELLLIDVGKF